MMRGDLEPSELILNQQGDVNAKKVEVLMPFQSEKQRRYLHANHPDIAKRWEQEYSGGGIARMGYAYGDEVDTMMTERTPFRKFNGLKIQTLKDQQVDMKMNNEERKG
jgi:hypothetical protein